jgi:hypothetical protein
MRPLALVAALAALALAPAVASAHTETAASGPVSATFTFRKVNDLRYRHLHLTVRLNGATVFDQPVATQDCEAPYCIPGGGPSGKSLHIDDLDGAGPPDVVLSLFTGGAHCCQETEIVALDGGGAVHELERNWGDGGFQLSDLDGDGVSEFVSGDDRFAYAFTAYAYSVLPVQIVSLAGDAFHDVTQDHPAQVRHDARRWRSLYRRVHADAFPQGVLAAYAADEYRLGRRAAARRFVYAQATSGKLRRAMGRKRAAHFAARLDRVLRKWGY